MKYPYEPKSNRKLEIGEFWTIQLPNNQFGCGIVLDIPNKDDSRVIFTAGLIDWINEMKHSNNGDPKPWVRSLSDAFTSEFERYLRKGPPSYNRSKPKRYSKIKMPRKFDLKNTSTDEFADQLTLICFHPIVLLIESFLRYRLCKLCPY